MGDKRPQRLVSGIIEVEEQTKKNQKVEEEKFEEEKAMPLGTGYQLVDGGKFHYESFNLYHTEFYLGYYVKVVPKSKDEECYVAFIKDIWQELDGSLVVNVQKFYKYSDFILGGIGDNELFYSLDCVDIPAEHVFSSCWVLFIPNCTPISEIPKCGEPVAFVVRVFYDRKEKKMFNVEDQSYKDNTLLGISYHFQLTAAMLEAHKKEKMNDAIQVRGREVGQVEDKDKVLLDSREKIEFYRTKMQDLVELLVKKYAEKCKQVAETASKLTIEEAASQERKMELHQAIIKMEQGGSADGIQKR